MNVIPFGTFIYSILLLSIFGVEQICDCLALKNHLFLGLKQPLHSSTQRYCSLNKLYSQPTRNGGGSGEWSDWENDSYVEEDFENDEKDDSTFFPSATLMSMTTGTLPSLSKSAKTSLSIPPASVKVDVAKKEDWSNWSEECPYFDDDDSKDDEGNWDRNDSDDANVPEKPSYTSDLWARYPHSDTQATNSSPSPPPASSSPPDQTFNSLRIKGDGDIVTTNSDLVRSSLTELQLVVVLNKIDERFNKLEQLILESHSKTDELSRRSSQRFQSTTIAISLVVFLVEVLRSIR